MEAINCCDGRHSSGGRAGVTSSPALQSTALFELAAWTEGQAYSARESGQNAGPLYEKSAEYLQQAAMLGHPIAMYRTFENLGMVERVFRAVNAQRNGNSNMLANLEPLMAEHGDLLFDAAELGYVAAIYLLDMAEDAGVHLVAGGGFALAELPTARDIENALNGRLRLASTTSDALISGAFGLPPGQALSCDDDWCTFAGYGYFRFSRPDTMDCEGGNDVATCAITFRYISRIGLGTGFWDSPHTELANAMASNLSRANPIAARISLQRTNGQWSLVGPIETY